MFTSGLVRHASFFFLFLVLPSVLTYLFGGPSQILTLNQMGITVILAISYNLLIGNAGLLSLGHAAYFGFGGFFAVQIFPVLAHETGWISAPLVPLLGGFAGLAGAIVLGSFTTRRGGLIFAMLSFAMAELVLASSSVFGRFYGGSLDRTELPSFLGQTFQSDGAVFLIVAIWLCICLLLAAGFNASPLGRMSKAVGENSERVEYVGYNQQRLKYLTFCLSGFIAGIAGGLFALTYEFVTPEIISLQQSWLILQMVFIGGIGIFWGPPVGAVILTLLYSALGNLTDIWNLYTGILFILVVLFAPRGITGIAQSMARKIYRLKDPLFRRVSILFGIASISILIGFSGLAELIYALHNPVLSADFLQIFGTEIPLSSLYPWLVFSILLTGGGLLLRKSLHLSRSQLSHF